MCDELGFAVAPARFLDPAREPVPGTAHREIAELAGHVDARQQLERALVHFDPRERRVDRAAEVGVQRGGVLSGLALGVPFGALGVTPCLLVTARRFAVLAPAVSS